MTPMTFSVRRTGGANLHFDSGDRAGETAIRLAAQYPGAEFILTAHCTVPPMTPQERGHARAAALTPEARAAIATNAAVCRAASLTPERRSEIAKMASLARWRGVPEPEQHPEG